MNIVQLETHARSNRKGLCLYVEDLEKYAQTGNNTVVIQVDKHSRVLLFLKLKHH